MSRRQSGSSEHVELHSLVRGNLRRSQPKEKNGFVVATQTGPLR